MLSIVNDWPKSSFVTDCTSHEGTVLFTLSVKRVWANLLTTVKHKSHNTSGWMAKLCSGNALMRPRVFCF